MKTTRLKKEQRLAFFHGLELTKADVKLLKRRRRPLWRNERRSLMAKLNEAPRQSL